MLVFQGLKSHELDRLDSVSHLSDRILSGCLHCCWLTVIRTGIGTPRSLPPKSGISKVVLSVLQRGNGSCGRTCPFISPTASKTSI